MISIRMIRAVIFSISSLVCAVIDVLADVSAGVTISVLDTDEWADLVVETAGDMFIDLDSGLVVITVVALEFAMAVRLAQSMLFR